MKLHKILWTKIDKTLKSSPDLKAHRDPDFLFFKGSWFHSVALLLLNVFMEWSSLANVKIYCITQTHTHIHMYSHTRTHTYPPINMHMYSHTKYYLKIKYINLYTYTHIYIQVRAHTLILRCKAIIWWKNCKISKKSHDLFYLLLFGLTHYIHSNLMHSICVRMHLCVCVLVCVCVCVCVWNSMSLSIVPWKLVSN